MNSEVNQNVTPETTGRFIVTFREGAHKDALSVLADSTGVAESKMLKSDDFGASGLDVERVPADGGAVLDTLGIAVVNIDPSAAGSLAMTAGEDSAILAVEPEGVMYALGEPSPMSLDYLRGFRDAAQSLYASASEGPAGEDLLDVEAAFVDTATLTWGLQATKVATSRYSGQGINVAVLDTGFFLAHPDFVGRQIEPTSFIAGVASANDGHGHGTHCIGTACGPLHPALGPRYGIAHKATIFVGKVLTDQGRGVDGDVLAGIDWAVRNKCHVISMSLGANVATTSVAYETAGQRALDAGCMIVAAAGNNAQRSAGQFSFVSRPANSRSFMAVGALDSGLRIADFSARDTVRQPGTAVDIAGPGVAVYSSWSMPTRYRTISGTSMATPHVAGIAALWAQASGARGAALWQRLIANTRGLSLPTSDVGWGLTQAP
ncbi:S8 family serine peptidase [Paraburkholderia sp. BR13439]|uniref:S8 family serine peptidase n=1 Tax=unclassified Paraburkholderia TaxID=2615204 RepID=UPI0034CDAB02